MPPQTRSQRRRQTARAQQRPNVSAETPYTETTTSLELTEAAAPAPAPARTGRTTRRVLTRAAPEPIDYSADYVAAGRDLRWIAIWTVLLFVAMFALKFSGLV